MTLAVERVAKKTKRDVWMDRSKLSFIYDKILAVGNFHQFDSFIERTHKRS